MADHRSPFQAPLPGTLNASFTGLLFIASRQGWVTHSAVFFLPLPQFADKKKTSPVEQQTFSLHLSKVPCCISTFSEPAESRVRETAMYCCPLCVSELSRQWFHTAPSLDTRNLYYIADSHPTVVLSREKLDSLVCGLSH